MNKATGLKVLNSLSILYNDKAISKQKRTEYAKAVQLSMKNGCDTFLQALLLKFNEELLNGNTHPEIKKIVMVLQDNTN